MKKLVSGIMTVAMLAQLGAFNVSAETTSANTPDSAVTETVNTMQLTDVYASTTGMKLTFSETTTAWDLNYIKSKIHIYDSSANEILYEPIRADKEVALEAELKIGEKYLLKIASDFECSGKKIEDEIQKNVEIVEKYRMDTVSGTWLDSELFWNYRQINGEGDGYHIQDNKIYFNLVKQNALILKVENALNKNNTVKNSTSEKYSIEFDLEAYGDKAYNYVLGVNKDNLQPFYYGYPANKNSVTFGWRGRKEDNPSTYTHEDNMNLCWDGLGNDGKGFIQYGGYLQGIAMAKHNSTSKVTWNLTARTDDPGKTDHSKTSLTVIGTPEKQTYHIDKIETSATLYSDKKRINRYDVKNYVKNNVDVENINKTGHFVISVQEPITNEDSSVDTIAVSNIVLTQSKVSDSVENAITLDNVYSSRKSMKLTFSDELVSSLSDTAIKNNITVSANSSNADYDVVKDKNTLTLNFKNNLTMDTPYTLTVKEGFGLGRNCVKETVEKHFKVKKVLATDFAKESYNYSEFTNTDKKDFYGINKDDGNRLYMKVGEFSYLYFEDVKDLSNYSVDFGMKVYNAEDAYNKNERTINPTNFAIVVNRSKKGSVFYGALADGKFDNGWNATTGKITRFFVKDWGTEGKNSGYEIKAGAGKATVKVENDVKTVSVDNTQATEYNFVIDKINTSSTIKIGDKIVDEYDIKNETGTPANRTPSEKGAFMISSKENEKAIDGVLAFTDFTFTTFEELDGITIEGLTVSNNENTLTGTIAVKNGTSTAPAAKVIIAAFDGEEMVTSCVATGNESLTSNNTSNFTYTLSGVGANNTLKVFVWDSLSGMKPLALNAKVFATTGVEIK